MSPTPRDMRSTDKASQAEEREGGREKDHQDTRVSRGVCRWSWSGRPRESGCCGFSKVRSRAQRLALGYGIRQSGVTIPHTPPGWMEDLGRMEGCG